MHKKPKLEPVSQEFTTTEKFTLYAAYPNPFNPETNIRYYIAQNSKVTISIYSQLGMLVFKQSKELNQGMQSFKWNATSSKSVSLTSGIYYLTISDGIENLTQKLFLVK